MTRGYFYSPLKVVTGSCQIEPGVIDRIPLSMYLRYFFVVLTIYLVFFYLLQKINFPPSSFFHFYVRK